MEGILFIVYVVCMFISGYSLMRAYKENRKVTTLILALFFGFNFNLIVDVVIEVIKSF
jgi:hypothetical protein